MKKNNKSFCIIGMTPFGQTIASVLEQQGHQVMIIDEHEELVHEMSEIATEALVLDPMSEQALKNAGVAGYSCVVVCFDGRINDSILLTMMLKDMGIPKVVVRAGSNLEVKVLSRVGADDVVFPEQDMGRKLAMTLNKTDVLDYLPCSADTSIIERKIPASWAGKSLVDLNLRARYGVNVIALKNSAGLIISIPPQRVFVEDDIVMLIGSNSSFEKIVKDN